MPPRVKPTHGPSDERRVSGRCPSIHRRGPLPSCPKVRKALQAPPGLALTLCTRHANGLSGSKRPSVESRQEHPSAICLAGIEGVPGGVSRQRSPMQINLSVLRGFVTALVVQPQCVAPHAADRWCPISVGTGCDPKSVKDDFRSGWRTDSGNTSKSRSAAVPRLWQFPKAAALKARPLRASASTPLTLRASVMLRWTETRRRATSFSDLTMVRRVLWTTSGTMLQSGDSATRVTTPYRCQQFR